MKKIVIISGLSGAGKSQALNILEDVNYFCIDNLPVELFDKFLQLVKTTHRDKFAVSIDVRSVTKLYDLVKFYTKYLQNIKDIQVIKIFLEASVKTLLQRFSETRRKHPLGGKDLISAIKKEIKLIENVKKQSDIIIDTTNLTINELKQKIIGLLEQHKTNKLVINIISFGYKFGLPLNSDIIIDTRFLPNPNYVKELKSLNGKNKKVKSYVLNSQVTQEFLGYIKSFLKFILPKIFEEGKSYFTISFGCTGGQHRSVVVAEEIYKYIKNSLTKEYNKPNFIVSLQHRDI